MLTLTLASSSPYRRDLLARLGLEFNCLIPDINEQAKTGESPPELVRRLAEEKALAVADKATGGLVIASDQVASLEQQILTKPGGFDAAFRQLAACAGKCVTFYTSLALLNVQTRHLQCSVETTEVRFRALSAEQVSRYLKAEEPYDCAGSFKVEGLGISLFSAIRGDDPNALIGLPLIRLVEFLANEGVEIP